jgi:hypothetical protein
LQTSLREKIVRYDNRQGTVMRRNLLMVVAAMALPGAAEATTVNTYSFTQANFVSTVRSTATGPGTLSSTFAGTLNGTGVFSLSDLSSLSLTDTVPTTHGTFSSVVATLADLTLFSFNTQSGTNLAIVAKDGPDGTCVGAPATLLPYCNPLGASPANTFGALLYTGILIARSDQAPVITLVSSVTTNPVPEPASWAMMVSGFGLLGAACRRRKGHTALV